MMIRKQAVVAAAVAGGIFVVAGVAAATIPDSEGMIHSCYLKSGGALRVIDAEAGQSCRPAEQPLDWNQRGLSGPQGEAGPQGPEGPRGPAGSDGAAEMWFESRPDDVTIPNDSADATGWQVIADLVVPAGSFQVVGATTIDFGQTNVPRTEGRCQLRVGGESTATPSKFVVLSPQTQPMSVTAAVTVGEPTSVELRCLSFEPVGAVNTTLSAIQLAAIHEG